MIRKLSRRRRHRQPNGGLRYNYPDQTRDTADHSQEEFQETLERVVDERDGMLRRLAEE